MADRAGRNVHVLFLGLEVVVKYFAVDVDELQQQALRVLNFAFFDLEEFVFRHNFELLVHKDTAVLEHLLEATVFIALKQILFAVFEHEDHLAQLGLGETHDVPERVFFLNNIILGVLLLLFAAIQKHDLV